ncbi:hypothetical protein QUA62_24040 [Microcoleus sp. MON1_C1]|uniref:hypothetical protein n=1 Tax=Microcoleus sp. MON1_C1 TaxID=2818827 RepID=UPI002FD1F715
MNLAQTATRHQFQARLDELHEISIALYAEVIAVMQRIEEIAIEREQVYREWETSWNEPAPAVTPAVKTIATKKLMLSIVVVKRITFDVPTCNFDPGELEIAGERASGDRRLLHSPGGNARW